MFRISTLLLVWVSTLAFSHSFLVQSAYAQSPSAQRTYPIHEHEPAARTARATGPTRLGLSTPATRAVQGDTEADNSGTGRSEANASANNSGAKQSGYAVDYGEYRDHVVYPVDPRKPCQPCTSGAGCHSCLPGLHGRPYQEREPGGCECGSKQCSCDRPCRSLHWPRPFSVGQNERHPGLSGDSRRPRAHDGFDRLRNFKLVNYTRTDNGYCGDAHGCNADRYGCVGESRHFGGTVEMQTTSAHE